MKNHSVEISPINHFIIIIIFIIITIIIIIIIIKYNF